MSAVSPVAPASPPRRAARAPQVDLGTYIPAMALLPDLGYDWPQSHLTNLGTAVQLNHTELSTWAVERAAEACLLYRIVYPARPSPAACRSAHFLNYLRSVLALLTEGRLVPEVLFNEVVARHTLPRSAGRGMRTADLELLGFRVQAAFPEIGSWYAGHAGRAYSYYLTRSGQAPDRVPVREDDFLTFLRRLIVGETALNPDWFPPPSSANRTTMLPTLRDIYSHRTATAWANLGDAHFDAYAALGQGDALRYVGGGCLDAPDHLPAGCTRTYGEGQAAYAMAVLYPRPDLLGSPQGLDAALNEAITALRLARQREASNRGQHTLRQPAVARTYEPHSTT